MAGCAKFSKTSEGVRKMRIMRIIKNDYATQVVVSLSYFSDQPWIKMVTGIDENGELQMLPIRSILNKLRPTFNYDGLVGECEFVIPYGNVYRVHDGDDDYYFKFDGHYGGLIKPMNEEDFIDGLIRVMEEDEVKEYFDSKRRS